MLCETSIVYPLDESHLLWPNFANFANKCLRKPRIFQGSLHASYFFGGDENWCKCIVNLRGFPWVMYCLGDNMMTPAPVPWNYFLTCISRGNAKYIDNPNWSSFDSGFVSVEFVENCECTCGCVLLIQIILTGFRIVCFCGQMKLCGCVWCWHETITASWVEVWISLYLSVFRVGTYSNCDGIAFGWMVPQGFHLNTWRHAQILNVWSCMVYLPTFG